MRVLVVDDDTDFIRILERDVPQSIEVVGVGSSHEAVGAFARAGPRAIDLAFVDLHMEPYLGAEGNSEGVALIRWIRKQAPSVPAVLVSSIDEARGRSLAREAGAIGFIRKPLDLERICRFLDSYAKVFQEGAK